MQYEEIIWTPEIDSSLKKMWLLGVRYDEMVSSLSKMMDREIAASSMHRRLVSLNMIGRRKRSNHTNTIWTPEAVTQLEQAWVHGAASASEIAKMLGAGFSRNAVIGKVHRMGIHRLNPNPSIRQRGGAAPAAKKAHGNRKRVLTPRARTQPHAEPVMDMTLVDDNKPGIGIMELRSDSCRAVLRFRGADGAARYCGDKALQGWSFCPGHKVIYYQPYERIRR